MNACKITMYTYVLDYVYMEDMCVYMQDAYIYTYT